MNPNKALWEKGDFTRIASSMRESGTALVATLDITKGLNVLDLGCGEGSHSIKLAERFAFHVLGVDPVPRHIELCNEARDAAAEASPDLRNLVRFELGAAEAIPVPDASVDLIWCREVLVHVDALAETFAECRRVLRPGGHMFIYQNFWTDRLEPLEAKLVGADVGAAGANADRLEAAFTAADFELVERMVLGSEIGERLEEDSGQGSRRLIHTARLLRDPERYIARFGQTNYDIMLGDCLWHVYRLLGKLSGRIYVLKAPGPPASS